MRRKRECLECIRREAEGNEIEEKESRK